MKHKLIKFVSFAAMAIVSFSTVFSGLASAAYYGAGTSANPYRIGDCSDLQNINNNLTADYIIVANIDCSGVSFTSLASSGSFTGILNGQDHTIKNLTLTSCGLFCQLSGATVQNITFSGGSLAVPAHSSAGTIAGTSTDATISNVHSNMTITGTSYDYLGGFLGLDSGGTTISTSSYTGTMTSSSTDSYIGGLVGFLGEDTDSTISNSYTAGSITETSGTNNAFVGGLIGAEYNGATQYSYSSSTLVLDSSSTDGQAGLIGLGDSGPDIDDFSASTMSNNNGLSGGLYGESNSSTTNDYFDAYLAGLTACTGSGTATCTAVNTANATPNYFKDNSTNGPFSTWDFNSTWSTTSGYPTLDDLADFTGQTGVPNNGDANGDGILDSYEANVLNLESNLGWVNISVPNSTGCTLGSGQSVNGNVPADPSYTSLTHMLDFDAYCPTPGMTIPVTLIFSRLIDTSGAKLLFYNPNTSSYSIVAGAAFSTTVIGGNTETEVTYNLTDGGPYDLSGAVNGLIEDPVVIATPESESSTSTPDTGYGTPNKSGPIVAATVSGSSIALIAGLLITYKQTRKIRAGN